VTAGETVTGKTPAPWTADRVVKGIGLMIFAGICSSLLHIGVRYVAPHLPSIEIVALRSCFTLLVMMAAMAATTGISGAAWHTRRLDLHVARGVVGVASMWTWYYALGRLPLADAGALSFTTGLFVTVGAALWFREKVGWRRISAVLVGFIGAIIVTRPGAGIITLAAIWAVVSSALWGLSLLMAKSLSKYDQSITISFYQPLITAPIAVLLAVPTWVAPSWPVLGVLFAMGIVAAAGNYCYVHALRIADASLVMPADYVRLIWMAGWGFLFFAEVPLVTTWIGAALIVGSTAFITLREQKLARERRVALERESARASAAAS
jgi:drug/metabolite transporter (DMT)-like permease